MWLLFAVTQRVFSNYYLCLKMVLELKPCALKPKLERQHYKDFWGIAGAHTASALQASHFTSCLVLF